MALAKAIEIISDCLDTTPREENPPIWDSIKLGLQALKRDQANRRINNHPDQALLPGETQEQ